MIQTFLPSDFELALLLSPLENINILGFFTNHQPVNAVKINNSIMACGESDELWWYVSCSRRDDFVNFLNTLSDNSNCFAVVNDWMLEEVNQHFNTYQTLTCYRFYLPEKVHLPDNEMHLELLMPDDAPEIFINSNYKQYTSMEYIQKQIKMRPGVCFRDKGKLAAWVLFHDDGALGMLHVVDEYRRRGIARAMLVDLCKRIRANGDLPFTSVEPDNIASLSLLQSIGFELIDKIHWVKTNGKKQQLNLIIKY